MLDARRGWVASLDGLYATTDGEHWVLHRIPAPRGLSEVDFVDPRHGWAAGPGALFRTIDGGATWTRLVVGCPTLASVHFYGPDDGVAVRAVQPAAATGGVAVATHDGGTTWSPIANAPADAQSICFADAQRGWLGAHGGVYATGDGGAGWTAVVPRSSRLRPSVATVQCAGPAHAWAEVAGPGGASSQEPHIGWDIDGLAATPVFAEQYFPHPHVHVDASSPGSYSGPFSAIAEGEAAFIDFCPACQADRSTVLAVYEGGHLSTAAPVPDVTYPDGVAFIDSSTGWVTGVREVRLPNTAHAERTLALTHTADGGRTWSVQLSLPTS